MTWKSECDKTGKNVVGVCPDLPITRKYQMQIIINTLVNQKMLPLIYM